MAATDLPDRIRHLMITEESPDYTAQGKAGEQLLIEKALHNFEGDKTRAARFIGWSRPKLYRRMRDAGHPWAARPDFERRMSELDLKNHEGMEMLRAHARFTAPGLALFGELEALERRHLAERTARGLSNVPTEVHVG